MSVDELPDFLKTHWSEIKDQLLKGTYQPQMIKRVERLPTDLVADEKHSWLKGQRVYIATTAGQACILGALVSPSAGQADL